MPEHFCHLIQRLCLVWFYRNATAWDWHLFPGKSFDDAISLADNEEIDTLVILENDLYRRAAEESVDHLFERSRQIIVLDHLLNKTSLHADILLPAATFAESEGTMVNNEGRAQRYYKALVNKDQVKESWQWIGELIKIKNKNQAVPWNRFDDIVSSLVNELPVFSKLKEYIPDADFRMLKCEDTQADHSLQRQNSNVIANIG